MTTKTKLMALGGLGALGAAAYGVARALRRRETTPDIDSRFDDSDAYADVEIEEIFVASQDDQGDINLDIVSRVIE